MTFQKLSLLINTSCHAAVMKLFLFKRLYKVLPTTLVTGLLNKRYVCSADTELCVIKWYQNVTARLLVIQRQGRTL